MGRRSRSFDLYAQKERRRHRKTETSKMIDGIFKFVSHPKRHRVSYHPRKKAAGSVQLHPIFRYFLYFIAVYVAAWIVYKAALILQVIF